MNIKTEITKMHYGCEKNLLYKFLYFPALIYDLITEIRNFLYDKNIIKSKKFNANIISIGNITTGGVGKTPIVAEIAKYYLSENIKTAIISRGYGGKLSSKNVNIISDGKKIFFDAIMAGDESYWYAKNLEGVVIITCASRTKAADYVVNKLGINNIILDDAFQHRKIFRNKNIVVIDSEKKFGNQRVLPQGPLRENIKNLSRADKIVVVSKGAKNYDNVISFANELNACICDMSPAEVYNIKTGTKLADNMNITAVCAIGQPEQFYNFLKYRFNIVNKITFDDHHVYSVEELNKINMPIVTTEKDAVKMKNFNLDNIYALKLRVNLNCLELLDD